MNSQVVINLYKKNMGESNPKKDQSDFKDSKAKSSRRRNSDEDLTRNRKDLSKKTPPKSEGNWRQSASYKSEELSKSESDSQKKSSPKHESKLFSDNEKTLKNKNIQETNSKVSPKLGAVKMSKNLNLKNTENKNLKKDSQPKISKLNDSEEDFNASFNIETKQQTKKKSEDSSFSSIEKTPSKTSNLDLNNNQDVSVKSEKAPETKHDGLEKTELNLDEFKRIALESQSNILCDTNWYFVDSNNKIQGPFNHEQMSNFFISGYLNMNLMVKRGIDENFLPLSLYVSNTGRIPFMSDTQLKQFQQLLQMQQIQLHQVQNFNILQTQLLNLEKAGMDTTSTQYLILLSKQLEQLQLKQKALIACGDTESIQVLNELAIQHDALCNQMNQIIKNFKQAQGFSDASALESNVLNVNPATLNTQVLYQLVNYLLVNLNGGMVDRNLLSQIEHFSRDKLIVLFEQLRKEEEKKRKMKEIQMKVKMKEEQRLLDEIRLRQQEEMKRLEEYRLKEEYRKELQRRKLEEVIKKQDEEKRNKKQIDEQKIVNLFQKKQEELNRNQLLGQTSYAEQNMVSQFPQNDLKGYLEKQVLEQVNNNYLLKFK